MQFIPLLAIIGGLISFIVWERRKKALELEKLRLEIEQLKKERDARIYIPTSKEIEDVLLSHVIKKSNYRIHSCSLMIRFPTHHDDLLQDFVSQAFLDQVTELRTPTFKQVTKSLEKNLVEKEIVLNRGNILKVKMYNPKSIPLKRLNYQNLKRKKYNRKTKFLRH